MRDARIASGPGQDGAMGMLNHHRSFSKGIDRRLRRHAVVWVLCAVVTGFGAASAHGAGPEADEPTALGTASSPSPHVRQIEPQAGRASPTERQALGTPEIESRPLSGGPDARRGTAGDGVQTIIVLAGVVAVILGLAVGVRKIARRHGGLMAACGAGGKSPSGVLSVLGRYPIARGQTLLLLQFDRRVILVGQTAGRGGTRLATLAELSDPDDVASVLVKTRDESGESVARKFREIVERMSEPAGAPERAVTVVPPVERADWFESARTKRARQATKPVPTAGLDRLGTPAATAPRGPRMDGATALRSRLDAMRAGGGR